MRNFRSFAAGIFVFLAACSTRDGGDPTAPGSDVPTPMVVPPVSSPYCEAKTEEAIRLLIEDLYFKNEWPDPNSALAKFNQVTSALAVNDVDLARIKTRDLVAFITNKFGSLTPEEAAETQDEYDALIADLWCFVGIAGQVFDLNPGDPEKVFKLPGVGGVWFPADVVPTGTMVVLTDISDQVNPLSTLLDQYSSYIDIQLIPSHTFTGQLPIVVVCPVDAPETGLLLGHNGPDGFELLADVDFSGIEDLATVCSETVVSLSRQPKGWLAQWTSRAVGYLLPRPLQASMLAVGGIGGSPSEFSPFGAVSSTLTGTDGIGGGASEFSPRPQLSNPDLPAAHVDGVAGTEATTDPDWPVVTIATQNGTLIPGVTVTFTIGAAQTFDPDSEAKLCDAPGGSVVSSVAVVTNSSGVATLPCLRFGTKAGFANVQATFDASTMGFTGDELVVVNSSVPDQEATSSLNWLVETTAGPASKILTYLPPSAPVAAASYDYGTGVEGAAVSPAPQVLVTDAYDNPVGGAGIEWSPLTAANGAVLVPGTAGATTNASGIATAESWTLGAGAHTLLAMIAGTTGDTRPTATFTASTPTGQVVFACAVGGNKTDLGGMSPIPGWMSIPKPSGAVREITLYMSITGQSSTEFSYGATFEVRKNSSTGPLLGGGLGEVTLPGNNGSPRPITFRLSNPVLTTEYGSGSTATRTLWIGMTFGPELPSTRKIQVWYNNSITKSNQGDCYNSLVYDPGSTQAFKRGLGINVTN